MTAFCFAGSPVPSIKVDPTNTNTVVLSLVSWEKDDENLTLFREKEAEILLDSRCKGSCIEDAIFDSGCEEGELDADIQNMQERVSKNSDTTINLKFCTSIFLCPVWDMLETFLYFNEKRIDNDQPGLP